MILGERFGFGRCKDQALRKQWEAIHLQLTRTDRPTSAPEDQHLIGRQTQRIARLHQRPALT